jgi:phage tail protein X
MHEIGGDKKDDADMMSGSGQGAPADGFKGYNKMTMDFVFYADATGILPIKEEMKKEFQKDDGKPSIRKHLSKLQSVVYGYVPEIHGPPYLKLVWGDIFPDTTNMTGDGHAPIFKGILKECKIEINLFSLSGEPVKAKINLSITSTIAPEARPLGNSPDLTHVYEITDGDKMTTFCNQIYGRHDSKICSAVAEYNNLIDWNLEGGSKITFPSIHMLNEKYLNDYEEVKVRSVLEKSEEERMRNLIGDKRAKQYYKMFPNKRNKSFDA